jgi:hypothetical protein
MSGKKLRPILSGTETAALQPAAAVRSLFSCMRRQYIRQRQELSGIVR